MDRLFSKTTHTMINPQAEDRVKCPTGWRGFASGVASRGERLTTERMITVVYRTCGLCVHLAVLLLTLFRCACWTAFWFCITCVCRMLFLIHHLLNIVRKRIAKRDRKARISLSCPVSKREWTASKTLFIYSTYKIPDPIGYAFWKRTYPVKTCK